MMEGFGLALGCAAILVVALFEMIRRRYIKGRFAVVWALVGVGTLVLAVMPDILDWAAQVAGVRVPLNLLFFIGFVGQLLILVQLTSAHSRLEEKMQRMAEALALESARDAFNGSGTEREPTARAATPEGP